MASITKYRCPLCDSPLSKAKWLEVTRFWDERDRLLREAKQQAKDAEKRGAAKERSRADYLQRLLKNRDDRMDRLQNENRELRKQLKRGTTPQLEGLLYEVELCRQLRRKFPTDKVTHHGHGGDVVQEILLKGRRVGRLVFECKKVQRLSSRYVEQARCAQVQRQADYAILVTTASKSNTFGFWTEKDVLVVHPAGVVPLTSWLRESLLKLAQARMTRQQREKAVRAILEFVDGPEFRNPLRDIVHRSEQLGHELRDEVQTHKKMWLSRVAHYETIWQHSRRIGGGLDRILEENSVRAPHGKLVPSHAEGRLVYPWGKQTLLLPTKT